MSRLASAMVVLVLGALAVPALAGDRGEGTLILGDSAISMVAAFAYTGQMADYDAEGNALDHYELLLFADAFDRAAVMSSEEPVMSFNEWLYEKEPASIEIHLNPTLTPTFVQANLQGEYHSKRVRCACEGMIADVKVVDGRLRGRIHSGEGLKWPDDGTDDPSGGQKLAFDVTFDVPLTK